MSGTRKHMICVHCLAHIHATITQAKRHGWCVWVGGAQCKTCDEKGINKPEAQP